MILEIGCIHGYLHRKNNNTWGKAKKVVEGKKMKVGTPEFSEFWMKWQKEWDLISYFLLNSVLLK